MYLDRFWVERCHICRRTFCNISKFCLMTIFRERQLTTGLSTYSKSSVALSPFSSVEMSLTGQLPSCTPTDTSSKVSQWHLLHQLLSSSLSITMAFKVWLLPSGSLCTDQIGRSWGYWLHSGLQQNFPVRSEYKVKGQFGCKSHSNINTREAWDWSFYSLT